MSWIITGSEKYETDPYRSNVSLLLHGDGTNGSTTIVDSSPTPKTVTAVGNAQISTAQSKFGGASISFDGAGDHVTVNSDATVLDLTSGDFTIEMWVRASSISGNAGLIAKRLTSAGFGPLALYRVSSGFSVFISSNNTTWNIASNVALGTAVLNTWHHVGLARLGSQFIGFLDGTITAVASSSAPLASSSSSWVIGGGHQESTADSLNGYIDDLRITKGIARYTSNFTPPTAPFPDI